MQLRNFKSFLDKLFCKVALLMSSSKRYWGYYMEAVIFCEVPESFNEDKSKQKIEKVNKVQRCLKIKGLQQNNYYHMAQTELVFSLMHALNIHDIFIHVFQMSTCLSGASPYLWIHVSQSNKTQLCLLCNCSYVSLLKCNMLRVSAAHQQACCSAIILRCYLCSDDLRGSSSFVWLQTWSLH